MSKDPTPLKEGLASYDENQLIRHYARELVRLHDEMIEVVTTEENMMMKMIKGMENHEQMVEMYEALRPLVQE